MITGMCQIECETSNSDERWGGFAGQVLTNGGPNPRAGKKSDQAHPPIHPLKAANNLQVTLTLSSDCTCWTIDGDVGFFVGG